MVINKQHANLVDRSNHYHLRWFFPVDDVPNWDMESERLKRESGGGDWRVIELMMSVEGVLSRYFCTQVSRYHST